MPLPLTFWKRELWGGYAGVLLMLPLSPYKWPLSPENMWPLSRYKWPFLLWCHFLLQHDQASPPPFCDWKGSTNWCFCDQHETIYHLFIFCPFTQMIWKIVYMTFNITSLMNITNIFGNWLNGVDKKKAKPTLELEFVLCYRRYECA
jgi:hypothetical protein